MIKVFSKKDKEKLLHQVLSDKENNFISDSNEFLQVSKHKLKEGEEINFHRNQFIINNTFQRITQESWLILSGKAQLITYDIDNSFLQCIDLCPGDCSITYAGGHGYIVKNSNTILYEIKTGPYFGTTFDKVLIK